MNSFLHILACLVLLITTGQTVASEEAAHQTATKNVTGQSYRFCFNPNWIPYEYNDNGMPRGIFMDYIQLLAQRMGIQTSSHFTPNWSASLNAIRKGECDFLVGAVKTKEREEFLDFTQPYYDAVFILIGKKDKPFVGSLNALAGQTICGAKNSAIMQQIARDFPLIKQVGIETTEQAINVLRTGKVDACVGSLDQVVTELGWFFEDSKIIGKLDYPYPISVAVRKDLPELRTSFDRAIESITDTDRSQIMRRWSYVNIEETVDYAIVWKTVGASLFLLGTFFLWNRKLQKEINQRKQAEAAKQSFMSMVSHELRTPLTAIIGMSSRLHQTNLDGRQAQYANQISHSSELLLLVINDILDFEKLEAGKFDIQHKPFKLNDIVTEVVDIISAATDERNLHLAVSLADDLPSSLVGDGLRLKQILLNLTNNATKFTEQGTIEIRVKCKKKEMSRCEVFFSVRDTGIGIPKEHLQSLFNPFFQVDTFLTRSKGGTGLGLAICHQLVERMGGRIWVESEVGKGSDFQFYIPFEIDHQAHVDKSLNGLSIVTPPAGLRGRRILLVEDNALNRQVAIETLNDAGVVVEIATNGQEAVEKSSQYQPEIILMDIQMPVMDGLEATRKIRAMHGCEHIPIIAMSAHTKSEIPSGENNPGFNDYLTKPIEPGVLYAALLQHLQPQLPSAPTTATANRMIDLSISTALPGIDVPSALKMTNGDRDRVLTRLCQFVDDMHDVEEQLRQCQRQSKHEDTRALIHALKGASSNIGATRLLALTTSFLRENDEQARSMLMDQIIGEMHLLQATARNVRDRDLALVTLIGKDAPTTEDWKNLGALIDLSEHIPEELLDKLQASMSSSEELALMKQLRQELSRFRYAPAGALFKKLCEIKAISDAS